MDPTCQQGNIQAGSGSVMVCGVSSWRDMDPLMCLDMILKGYRYVTCTHPCPLCILKDLGKFQQDNAMPHKTRIPTEWLQEHSS
ncbi:uncharacterized protein TNCV_1331581 [Trichonephila clavipes]|nr:uncharacterized protein TNCV_1331581 [Trichonephila clavipes]